MRRHQIPNKIITLSHHTSDRFQSVQPQRETFLLHFHFTRTTIHNDNSVWHFFIIIHLERFHNTQTFQHRQRDSQANNEHLFSIMSNAITITFKTPHGIKCSRILIVRMYTRVKQIGMEHGIQTNEEIQESEI